MKNKISYFTLGIIVGIIITVMSVSISNEKNMSHKKVLKLAHGLETTHPVHLGMLKLKDKLEELSNGELSLDIYSGGSLGGEVQCIEQVKNGSLDMTKASSASLGTFVEEISTLTLPYLFNNSQHYWKVLDSSLGDKFLNFLEKGQLVGLCYYDAGSRSFYSTKKPIKTPQDLVGMKVRVMNSKTDMQLMEAFGAAPTPINAGEIYTALSQGVVDAAENNFPTYLSSAHYEIAKYFTVDEHTSTPDILIIGQTAWNKLSKEEQAIFKEASKISSIYQRQLWADMTQEAKEKLLKAGVEITYPNKEEFKAKAQKVYEGYKGTNIGNLAEEISKIK